MKKAGILFIVLLTVVLIVGYLKIYLPINRIKAQAKILLSSASEIKTSFSQNNIDLLSLKLDEIIGKYKVFEKEASALYWAGFIPYVADFKNGVEAGDSLLIAAKESIEAIKPYADLIGFKKGTTSFVEKSAEDRLQTAVLTLDKVLTKLDKISDQIKTAEEKIDKIDPNRYPEKFNNIKIKSQIESLKEQFKGISSLFVDAKPLLKNIPNILGKDKEKVYLVLFQNDKELRATGGFLTAYAVFNIKNGKIKIQRSDDIYSLDNSISVHPPAPKEILNYHKDVSKLYIRDSNLSPDFVRSIEMFDELYQKSSMKSKYDGVIAVDSKILVDMLSIFGDTEADGVIFSAKQDSRCECPQVIYKLFDMVDRPVNYVKENRKGILGDLMYVLFHKALGFSPSKYWGTLAETMFKNLNEKHILLNFNDKEIQKAVEKLNYAGRVRNYNGDYLYINNVNFAGAKSNLFVSQTVTSKTTFKSGAIEREVTIEFRNPYPASDCNLERGGLCLNATLRNWIRVYVPEGSSLKEFQGSQKKVNTFTELGKTVFEGFMTVDPKGKATVVVSYTLPKNMNSNNYSLLVQKQPGSNDKRIKIFIDGKKSLDSLFEKDIETKK